MTKEEFLKNVGAHTIEIINDNGIYRHLRFSRLGSRTYAFDLATWPGHLCVTGDMGEWVFSRHGTRDMFNFFGCDIDKINLSYWAEKCRAVDKDLAISEYSESVFRKAIDERLAECGASEELTKAVMKDVFYRSGNECDARDAVDRFNNTYNNTFHDFWEIDLTEFTPHYIWICHAIVWGIAKYRDAKMLMQQASNAVGENQAVSSGQIGRGD